MAQWQYQVRADPLLPPAAGAPDLSWQPSYPHQIVRSSVRAADQLGVATGAVPSTFVLTHLGWTGQYPSRTDSARLLPARMPSFFLGPLVPIPNPVSTAQIEDRPLIGQNRSLDISPFPSIGGSSSWN